MPERDWTNADYEDWLRETGGQPGGGYAWDGQPTPPVPPQETLTTPTAPVKGPDPVDYAPVPTGTTTTNTGGGNNGWGYLTEPFTGQPPAWQAGPQYTAPGWTPPPDFSYKEFQVPTADSIYADPSYQFRLGEGQRALGAHALAKGNYNTGGTLKDFINYGQNAASQEYSNIYNRAVDTHNLGLNQALGTYTTNYGVAKDTRDYLYDTSKAEFAPQQRENELINERNMNNFLAEYDIFEGNRKRAGDYLLAGANLGGV